MGYTDLDRLIDELQTAVENSDPQKGYWKALWNLVREIGSEFKNSRYPTKEGKDSAYNRFQELVAKARDRSEVSRARVNESQREWERREKRSRDLSEEVQSKATGSRPTTTGERALADLIFLPITIIRRIVEDILGVDDRDGLEEIRHELVACNEKLRGAWAAFNEFKKDLLPGDKNNAYQSLQEANEKLNEGWRHWKESMSALQNRRQQEWEQRQRERKTRNAEREGKQRLFFERVENNIEKLEEKLNNARSALERQEDHLEDLREKYSEAWSDGFRERCSEWIDETEDRIDSIKEHIERLEGWIEQERDKLR
jgi:hypothetical protein